MLRVTWDHPSFASAVPARTSLRRLADVLVRIQIGQGAGGGDFVVCAKAGTAKKAAATAALRMRIICCAPLISHSTPTCVQA